MEIINAYKLYKKLSLLRKLLFIIAYVVVTVTDYNQNKIFASFEFSRMLNPIHKAHLKLSFYTIHRLIFEYDRHNSADSKY